MQPSKNFKKTKEHLKWQWMTLMLDPKSDLVLKKKRKKKLLPKTVPDMEMC